MHTEFCPLSPLEKFVNFFDFGEECGREGGVCDSRPVVRSVISKVAYAIRVLPSAGLGDLGYPCLPGITYVLNAFVYLKVSNPFTPARRAR